MSSLYHNLLNYSKLVQAVRLIADLLLDHQITDVQLWNSVLQKLMAFQQVMYSFYLAEVKM